MLFAVFDDSLLPTPEPLITQTQLSRYRSQWLAT
jgi:hypothetical protein